MVCPALMVPVASGKPGRDCLQSKKKPGDDKPPDGVSNTVKGPGLNVTD
jgi:hypothetical protein